MNQIQIALLIEKNFESAARLKRYQLQKLIVRNAASTMFQNKKLKRNATSAIAEVALCGFICSLPSFAVRPSS